MKKIFSPTELKSKLRGVPGRIVFTNGCFDILHRGHVELLRQAKKAGDFLIVALNSDQSVRGLKGSGRPIHSLKDRLEVISALECVDAVTWFSDSTPLKLITRLRPHVLVKGGDYKPGQIVGAQELRAWGGRVKIVPLVRGKSTSGIIERL